MLPTRKKNKKESLFVRINKWLHLWLGLLSGIVVFVVCLTAAIWVFRDEVAYFTKPSTRVALQPGKPVLPPSILEQRARQFLDSALADIPTRVLAITYRSPDQTAFVSYMDSVEAIFTEELHLNPYTGAVVYNERYAEDNTRKFFQFIREGHRFFWLPEHIGSPLVGTSCIIFMVSLITGLIWWYPRKWSRYTRSKNLKIKWKAGWKRVNLDLHNVLGFYSLLFALILTYTGVYYSFDWFQNGYHYLLGVQQAAVSTARVPPAAGQDGRREEKPLDVLWEKLYFGEGKSAGELTLIIPRDSLSPVSVMHNPEPDRQYRIHIRYFGRHNLEELKAEAFSFRRRDIPFEKLTAGQKIIRLNHDIHTGTIGGLPTKLLAAVVSLIGASLPITGFIIWYNRRWGKKRKAKTTAAHRSLPATWGRRP